MTLEDAVMDDLFFFLTKSLGDKVRWINARKGIIVHYSSRFEVSIHLLVDSNIAIYLYYPMPYFVPVHKVSLANPNYKEDIVNYIGNMEKP